MNRPFFHYYGGKWRAAAHYPPPRYSTIVEPFAGAAGYSVRLAGARNVILVDPDENIAATWRYLLSVSPEEILALPDIENDQSVHDLAVPPGARTLIGWWLTGGDAHPVVKPGKWMRAEKTRNGPGRGSNSQMQSWGPGVRRRIAEQLPCVQGWTFIQGDYTQALNIEATWFIDPPYQRAGKHYRKRFDDYMSLAAWCTARKGQVIVCENAGATWLPFEPFRKIRANQAHTNAGTTSDEALYLQDPPGTHTIRLGAEWATLNETCWGMVHSPSKET